MKIWPFTKTKSYTTVPQGYGRRILESFTGAWQRNIEFKREDVLSYHAVFACVTLIAGDIAKLYPKYTRKDSNGIWVDVPLGDYGVIKNPNSYQNRIQFIEAWVNSKLTRGNAYILKVVQSGIVTEMHVLNPDMVLPLVSDTGDVFYQIGQDNLAGVSEAGITVPASQIIHDRFNCLYHPLVGLSPLFASGLPAYMGRVTLENNATYFANGSRPSGILTVPEMIDAEAAAKIKQNWKENYSGKNSGNVAIIGGDVKYTPLSMTAQESQMVELLGITSEMVCSTFHVPPHKIGMGESPSYNNVQALNLEYYNSCLHRHIEDIELLLDEGLGVPEGTGFEFDLEGLLRMDSKTQVETLAAAVQGSVMPVNVALKRLNISPVDGGEYIWMQQQNYSLQALAKRDEGDPFAKDTSVPQAIEEQTRAIEGKLALLEKKPDDLGEFAALFKKEFGNA